MQTSVRTTVAKEKKQGYSQSIRAKQKEAKVKAKAVLTEALGISNKASGTAPSTPKRAVEAPGTPKGESTAKAETVGTPVGGIFPPPLPKLPWMVVEGSKAAEAAEAATLAEKAAAQTIQRRQPLPKKVGVGKTRRARKAIAKAKERARARRALARKERRASRKGPGKARRERKAIRVEVWRR